MNESHWRKTARAVIERVRVANLDKTPSERLALIDAAYPFGERKYHPYKIWLAERRRYTYVADVPPSQDEADACMVARDLVEEGRTAEAETFLDEHAPHRLERKCPACGANAGKACREPFSEPFHQPSEPPTSPYYGINRSGTREMVVPHVARVEPRHGPLFEAVQR